MMIQDGINNLKKNIKNNISNAELIKKSTEDNYYMNKVKESKHLANIKSEYDRIYDQVANDPDTKEYLRLRFKQLYDELNRNKINTLLYSTPQAIDLENEMKGEKEIVDEEIKTISKKKKDQMSNDLKKLKLLNKVTVTIEEINDYNNKFDKVKNLERYLSLPLSYTRLAFRKSTPKYKDDYIVKINRLNNRLEYLQSMDVI